MTYLPRVATVTLRALNGVSQLVLICANTPEAVPKLAAARYPRARRRRWRAAAAPPQMSDLG